MILPRGITGFGSINTNPPLFLDEKAFRRMCHALARENGGAVTEESVFLLQNIHYPYAAFAQRDASGRFVLIQQPEWLRLPEIPVRFLNLAELNQNWRGLCGELSPEELEQIRYWNPQTVGEIIFNTWD